MRELSLLLILFVACDGSYYDGYAAHSPITPATRTTPRVITIPYTDACNYKQDRLPQNVRPTVYDLEMQTSIPNRNFNGSVRITLKILQETTMVILHTKDLTILSATLTEDSSDMTNLIDRLEMCEASSQLQLTSKTRLVPMRKYSLKFVFQAPFRDDMHGFYGSDYIDDTGKKVTLATTQFEDLFARTAFPCFDEPSIKAVFRMKMTHDSHLLVLFNTPVKSTEAVAGRPELITTSYQDTPLMSTYLVAFTICDFEKISARSRSGIEVSFYAVRQKLNQTDFALQIAIGALDFYEKFFKIPYPLPKLDLIAIPDFAANAMENWGLISYRESWVLFDAKESGVSQMDLVSTTVAHEIAHQWFGNLVTMTWWDQLWLNEGFATFMQQLGADAAMPALTAFSRFSTAIMQSVLTLDTLSSTHPILTNVTDPSEIAALFDEITYSKGASVLLMLYESLGPPAFQKGVTNYLNEHKFGNAVSEALWSSLDDAWHSNTPRITTKKIADKWTLQAGFPLVTAALQPDRRFVSVSQKRISPDTKFTVRPSSSEDSWIIPLNYLTASSPQNSTNLWLDEQRKLVAIGAVKQRWFKFNAGQKGFYRVNYDPSNWDALTEALKENPEVMAPEDRANLLDDAFSLAKIGQGNLATPFSLAAYLTKERHFVPWITVTSHFDWTDAILFDTDVFAKFRRWRQKLVQPAFANISCSSVPSDNIFLRRQCLQIFEEACRAGLPACIQTSRQMFDEGTTPVDLRAAVYHAVIKHGSTEDWNRLWARYLTTQIASEKSAILDALTITQDILLVERLLKSAFDPAVVRPQDSIQVFTGLSKNYVGRDAAWRTIKELWDDTLVVTYGEDPALIEIFKSLQWMTSNGDLEDVKEFFNKRGRNLGSGALPLSQAIETIELRRKFLDNSLTTFDAILVNS